MEYENIDEAARYQEACRKVKRIAEAIKHIKIKYYPNFAKISEQDKQVYDELNVQMEQIASENGLSKLKAELIGEISERYDGNIPSENEEQGNQSTGENILKAYYGAIDAGKQALSEGKLTKALICQREADAYMKKLEENGTENAQLVEMAVRYKREKFAELLPVKEKANATNWEETMKGCYKNSNAQDRSEAAQQITQQAKENVETEKITEEMLLE